MTLEAPPGPPPAQRRGWARPLIAVLAALGLLLFGAAAGLLMEKEGLNEADAFARLRRASQVSGRPLKVVAEAVVATLGQQ